jgi:hypothetical protein
VKKFTCVVLGLAILMAGCGKKIEEKISQKLAEKAIEHGTKGKAKVDLSGGSMKIETKEGTMAGGTAAKIPDNFPSDIFLLKPSKVIMSMESADKGLGVGLETDKDAASVTETYKKSMTGSGWTQKSAVAAGKMAMLAYEKEKRTVNIIINQKDAATNILINVPPAKK